MLNLCKQQSASGRGPREHLARLSSTVRVAMNHSRNLEMSEVIK